MSVMNVRRLIPTVAVAGACVLAVTTLSACSGSDTKGKGGDKLKVTASFYPMEFLAKEIGGKHVEVKDLTPPGTEPHDLELSPKQTAELGESDVIVYLKGIQPAVDQAVKQSGVKHTADATSFTSLRKHGHGGHSHEHGDHDHGDHGHEDGHKHEAHSHKGHSHSHDPNANDPHIWLDPVKYAEVAKGVNKTLAAADPDHKADFQKNTDELVKKLQDLDKKYADGLKNKKAGTFITTHAAFGYLAERYQLREEAINGLDPESGDVSGARRKEIQEIAKKYKVNTVFFETLASDTVAKQLAEDVGAKTDVLDPLEGITDKSKGRDYFQIMESNLTALQKALGAE